MSEDWKTPEIRAAEELMEERMRQAEEALEKVTRFEAELPEIKLTDDKIEEIEQLIRSGQAPAEIAALQERIDAGEFSWRDIADGSALRDESVQAAFSASVQNMQHAKELLDAGYDAATVINNDPNRPAQDSYDDEPPDSFLR
ncbi:hypothetical protein MOQ72_06295 [Saccharopolyspora sp. K220]|uniref:hypothetical protein n=1 Tax=Saccharopolyspora soli TaxID=2926618 RepID=UPI001F5A8015|nr:hypothetical protein [Saccharopolyspora soli]MCI2417028.1 hypothetical protein [Saccharopolyspora soli]